MHTPLYLDAPDAVDRFLRSIAGAPILALDTEGASFHRFVDRIYLLQLSTRERCEQRAPGAEQIHVQRTTSGRLEAAGTDGVHSDEQGPEVLNGLPSPSSGR